MVHLQQALGTVHTSELGVHPKCSTTKHGKHINNEAGDIQSPLQ